MDFELIDNLSREDLLQLFDDAAIDNGLTCHWATVSQYVYCSNGKSGPFRVGECGYYCATSVTPTGCQSRVAQNGDLAGGHSVLNVCGSGRYGYVCWNGCSD